ncbi:heme peroxidase, partial [Gonapodya prolifera JEL478]
GTAAPLLIRLAWHDAGTYSLLDGSGGMHATIQFPPMANYSANLGLDVPRQLLREFKSSYPKVSTADMWAFAASVAITATGGPLSKQARSISSKHHGLIFTPADRMPNPSLGEDHVRYVFTTRMGFTDAEAVALMGAHTLGRAHLDRSGYVGAWSAIPTDWTNSYYTTLTDLRFVAFRTAGQLQYTDGSTIMLPTDMSLVFSNTYRYWVYQYAANPAQWSSSFAKAWIKLTQLGYQSTDL